MVGVKANKDRCTLAQQHVIEPMLRYQKALLPGIEVSRCQPRRIQLHRFEKQ